MEMPEIMQTMTKIIDHIEFLLASHVATKLTQNS